MAFEDFGVEILAFAAADAVDEIAKRTAGMDRRLDIRKRLALLFSLREELAVLDDAFVGMELVGDLRVPAVDQTAILEDDLRPAEVDDGQLRVRRLPLVLIAEPAAQADDAQRRGPSGNAQRATSI